MSRLDGRIALVTGGSRGIGAAVARTLAARGAAVMLTYRNNAAGAEEVVRQIRCGGGEARAFQADVTDAESVAALIAAIAESARRIDILVNNAGISATRAFAEIDRAFFTEQFDTNVWGTIQVTQAALPYFPESGGRVINLSTQRIFAPRDGLGLYAATKAAVSVLTHALAIELGPRRITVNAVAPAATRTDMTAGMPAEKRERLLAATPLQRLGEPEDIAAVVAFLASDDAGWITGRTLRADGGIT